MDIYLSTIEIKKYRSCNKTSMQFNEDLSALIGTNGSGKSNFLNGVLLLKKLANISRHIQDDEFPLLTCRIKATFVIEQKTLPFEAVIKYATNELNIDQVISAEQKWNFKEFTGEDKLITLPLSSIKELKDVIKLRTFEIPKGLQEDEWRALLFRSFEAISGSTLPQDAKQVTIVIDVFEKVFEFITKISYYSASQFTDPSKCPTYFEIQNERIVRRPSRGWNEHQKFMFDLYSAFKNPNSKFQEFLSIVGNEGIGLIDTINYDEIEVPTNEYAVGIGGKVISKGINKLLVIPNFIINSFKLSPNQLSEGTFKTLAIVFYLITDTSRLLIIEEPEVCIHHGLLASILELIKEFSYEKQIIISTHSDFVLDELDPENVFIVKNNPKSGTSIKHIPDALSVRDYKALKDYLQESGNLGEYWRHGELEK
jgi:predicted ATP-dependent endonuclease of OLD family